jgi:hypothetical protein
VNGFFRFSFPPAGGTLGWKTVSVGASCVSINVSIYISKFLHSTLVCLWASLGISKRSRYARQNLPGTFDWLLVPYS